MSAESYDEMAVWSEQIIRKLRTMNLEGMCSRQFVRNVCTKLPEDRNIDAHRRDSLKSRDVFFFIFVNISHSVHMLSFHNQQSIGGS